MRALSKIEQIMPPRLGRRVAALQAVVVPPAPAGSSVDGRALSDIAGACRSMKSSGARPGGVCSPRRVVCPALPRSHQVVHSCFFDTGSATHESLAMHLVLLGVDFELTEPVELVEQVRRLTDWYRRATAHLEG